MTPVFQDKFMHEGERGNCVQASLASFLDLPLEKVPAFQDMPRDEWKQSLMLWVSTQGYYFYQQREVPTDVDYYLGIYDTGKGYAHCVVCSQGEIVHDPFLTEEYRDLALPLGELKYCWVLRSQEEVGVKSQQSSMGSNSNHSIQSEFFCV